jgi:tetratricopeptide (TPR) repeat protein
MRFHIPSRVPRAGAMVLALLCTVAGLWAPPPAAAQETQGEAPQADARLAFARGVVAYRAGDFETARQRFEEAARLSPDDGTIHHWLGLTYLNLDRPRDAAGAFRSSLRARLAPPEPEEVRARLEEARRRVAETLPDPPPLPAPEWIGTFRVLPETPSFDGRVYLGVGQDSNPNLLPDDLTVTSPDGDPVSGEDSDTVILADARVGFQAANEEAGRTFGVALLGSQSLYGDFDYLDFRRLGGVASFSLGKEPAGFLTGPLGYTRTPRGLSRVTFLLQVGVSKDWLDGDDFADRLEGAATLALNEGSWGQIRLSAGYRDTEFEDDPPGTTGELLARSGESVGGELAQYLYLGARDRYLRLGVGLWEHDAGLAYDRSTLELGGELALPLRGWGDRTTLYLDTAHRTDDHDEPVSNRFAPFGEPREDEVLTLGGSLVVRVLGSLFVSGRAAWTDHEIDQPAGFAAPDLSYERTFAALGATWVF